MKFSHSIQFNAVPDWSSHYIAYSNLKKLSVSLTRLMPSFRLTLFHCLESTPSKEQTTKPKALVPPTPRLRPCSETMKARTWSFDVPWMPSWRRYVPSIS